MDDLLIRWHRLPQEREPVMGSDLMARLADLLAAWRSRTSEQEGMMSRVQMARTNVSWAWDEVAWAGYALARAIVDDNPRQPNRVDVYFDFRMFTRAQNRDTDGKADIRGTVTGPAGFPVFRALVTFTQVEGGKVYQLRSNSRGVFRKKRMLPSVYDVTVRAAGFAPFQGRVQLLDRANPDLNVVLQAV